MLDAAASEQLVPPATPRPPREEGDERAWDCCRGRLDDPGVCRSITTSSCGQCKTWGTPPKPLMLKPVAGWALEGEFCQVRLSNILVQRCPTMDIQKRSAPDGGTGHPLRRVEPAVIAMKGALRPSGCGEPIGEPRHPDPVPPPLLNCHADELLRRPRAGLAVSVWAPDQTGAESGPRW